VRPAEVEELSEGDPFEVALENARRKAEAIAGDLVVGVDTLVTLRGEIYGKPRDEAHARETLAALGGQTHQVISGVAVKRDGAIDTMSAVTHVTFRPLNDELMDWYVACGEWHERAGGYAIQGRGAALVREIRGDYLNVVGLPVATLLDMLGW
jgi:septum formation protein